MAVDEVGKGERGWKSTEGLRRARTTVRRSHPEELAHLKERWAGFSSGGMHLEQKGKSPKDDATVPRGVQGRRISRRGGSDSKAEDPGHFLQSSHLPLLNSTEYRQNRSNSGERGSPTFCSSALRVKPNSPKFSKRFSTQQMDTLGWECYLHVPAKQSFLELPQEVQPPHGSGDNTAVLSLLPTPTFSLQVRGTS